MPLDGVLPPSMRPLTAGARAAVTDVAPIVLAMVPFAVVLGVAVDASVVNDVVGGIFTPILYAGAAHFATMSVLDAGGSAVTAVCTALIVNARFMMYGAAMAWRFVGQPDWFRWLGPWLIVDQTFALASARGETEPAWFRGYWLTAGGLLGTAFTALVFVGIAVGPIVPDGVGLAFSIPALFLALLIGQVHDRPAVVAAIVGAVVTALALELPHGLGLVAGALAGATGGLVAGRTA